MTVRQIQHLLAYLGYYTATVDGIWGSFSASAVSRFQRDYGGLTVDGVAGEQTQNALKQAVSNGMSEKKPDDFWANIRHWNREEFRCRCGGKYCDGFPAEMDGKLMKVADRVRGNFGAEAFVSSGVRCNQHNANVGGVSNSRHLYGKAMDFCISGKNGAEVLEYVLQQPEISYAYNIDGTYIHMDVE